MTMASIHKDPRGKSPFYFAAYYDGRGRRRFRSTKERNRHKALKIAMAWGAAAEKSREGSLTATQTQRVLAELVQQSTGESLSVYTIKGWLDQWLASKEATTSEATHTRYTQVVTDFLKCIGSRRANAPLSSINPTDVLKYRAKLHGEGRSASTVNLTITKILTAPLNAACRQGYIQANPAIGIGSIKAKGAEAKAHREPFTDEEIGVLIEAANGQWKGAIIAGVTTGLRLTDIARLTWGNLDLEKAILTVETRKTGKEVVLPLHPDLTDWLAKQTRGIGNAFLFPKLADQTTGGKHGLSLQFKGIMERAGVVGKVITRKGAGRTTSSKSFHSLRHTFVSCLANSGIAPDVRQRLSGHSDLKTHLHYTHHALETLRGAIDQLPRHRTA